MSIISGKFDGGFKEGIAASGNEHGKQNSRPLNQRQRKDKPNRRDYSSNDRGPRGAGRSYGESGGKTYRSSYLDDSMDDSNSSNERKPAKLDQRTIELDEFCDAFASTTDYRQIRTMVQDDLPEVIKAMNYYYSNNSFDEKTAILNKFVKIVCTSKFANALASVMDSRVWLDDGTWDDIWMSVATSISIALETNYERMHSDVVRSYVRDMLPRIWQPEITDIARRTGVTRDLALDLLIAIPMVNAGKKWSNTTIGVYYDRFVDKMLVHADDNMDILNWEIQGILFDIFFDNKNQTNLKVIGRYLAGPRIQPTGETVKDAVYNEFIKMLYNKLNEFDIKEIGWCLEFVANNLQALDIAGKKLENPVFSFAECKKYDNVMKGLADAVDRNEAAATYLAK